MSKKNVLDFINMKMKEEKIAFLTSYDFLTTSLAERSGIDILLLGDSLGMCVYGYEGTLPAPMEQTACPFSGCTEGSAKHLRDR